jgi:hypothetical protein
MPPEYLIYLSSVNIQMELEEVFSKFFNCRFAESLLQSGAICIDVKNLRIFTKQLIRKFVIIQVPNDELPKR